MVKNNIITDCFLFRTIQGKNEDLFTAQGKFDPDRVEDDYRDENQNGSHLQLYIRCGS